VRRVVPAAGWLALVVLGATGLAPAAAQPITAPVAEAEADQCLYNQATPPAPADGTVVLAAHASPADPTFVVEIIPADGVMHQPTCTLQIGRHPTSIGVGKGAAVEFWDITHDLSSNWGAVNVGPTDPAPVFFPGRSDFTPTLVTVEDTAEYIGSHESCRACVLSGKTVRLDTGPAGSPSTSTAYEYDLTDAQLDNTTIVGRSDFSGYTAWMAGWNLSNANLTQAKLQADLTGATLTGAVLDGTDLSQTNLTRAVLQTHLEHTIGLNAATLDGADLSGASLNGLDFTGAKLDGVIVNGTVFDGSNLRGARLTQLKFTASPSFNLIGVGQANGACTTFQDLDLHAVSLMLANATTGCENSPLLPGTSVSLDVLASLYHDPALAGLAPNVNVEHARFVVDASNRSSLAGLDLHGLNLSGTKFLGWPIDLSGTKLDGASLPDASFQFAELSGATFHGANAARASFRGAHLAAANGLPAASFAGSQTNLQGANFIEADVSGASFASADLSTDPTTGTPTAFDRALANRTDFTGVTAKHASFVGAHVYGNGRAFDQATDLSEIDFTNALLAGDIKQGGGFDLAGAPLTKATFNGAQCIACNFTGAHLDQASLVGAYLPGVTLSNAIMDGANLDNAWLYCDDVQNSACPATSGHWSWKLDLGFGEVFGPVPFNTTNLTSAALGGLAYCPDGNGPDRSNGCVGDAILPSGTMAKLPLPCSADGERGAVALRACATSTTTLFDAASNVHPLATAAATPPTWATAASRKGFYVGLDDATIRQVGAGPAQLVAGQAGERCADATASCGDGGPAGAAQLGKPSGLAVGLDGAVYVADSDLHRVRRIDYDGKTLTTITTVAGTGQSCDAPTSACGDGGLATEARLSGPKGVWIDPSGHLWIADGARGLREVLPNGTIISVGVTPGTYTVQSVVGDDTGNLYAGTSDPDYLLKVVQPSACEQLQLTPGDLVHEGSFGEIDLMDQTCQRRPMDQQTQTQLGLYDFPGAPLKQLSHSQWLLIPAGPPVPNVGTDPAGYAALTWALYQPVCVKLGVALGDLIQLEEGTTPIWIVDTGCRHHRLPNSLALTQIEQTYRPTIKTLPSADAYQIHPSALGIPDASTDPTGFDRAMQQIYGPPRTEATAETPSVTAVSVGGHSTTVVGTGTSGYNGTTNFAGILLPANQVQVNQPMGLALRQDGAILFADSGNNLIRAYVPAYNHVVDVGGLVDDSGTPQGGFNQDNLPANKTELAQPRAVSATGQAVAMFVVADTANGRVRLLGPSALHSAASPNSLAPDGSAAAPTPAAASSVATPLATPTEAVVTPVAGHSETPVATPSMTAVATPPPERTATPAPERAATTGPERTATPPVEGTPKLSSTSAATPVSSSSPPAAASRP
jgi:uncharacterized protein YjbI with pentapeptide repeats